MSNRKSAKTARPLYVRFILSFVAILSIPILIISAVFSSRFLSQFENEVLETVDMELEQMVLQTDNLITQMQGVAARLSIDGTLYSATKARNPIDFLPVMNYLSIVCNANSQFDDIIILLDNAEYTITSTTTWRKDHFYRANFDLQELAIELLEANENNGFRPKQINGERIGYRETDTFSFFVLPLYSDYLDYKGNIIFKMRNDVFSNFVGARLSNYNASVILMNDQGQIAYSTDPDIDFDRLVEINTQSKQYIIRACNSASTLWSCYALIARSHTAFDQVMSISREFIVTIFAILILASFAIVFLSRMNYSPINKLTKKVSGLVPEGSQRNEIENISHTIDYLKTENISLSAKLEESITAVRNIMILRLISGEYNTISEFNEDAADQGLSLPKKLLTVAIIRVREADDEIAHTIKSAFDEEVLMYCLNSFSRGSIVFLSNTDTESEAAAVFNAIHTFIASTLNREATIGIGSTVDEAERIPKSYIDASSALDYRFIKGNGTVIDYREAIGNVDEYLLYPNKEFEVLSNALSSMNKEAIEEAIASIVKVLSMDGIPLYLARNICFDLIHRVSKSKAFNSSDKIETPFKLTGMETAKEIIDMVVRWQQSLEPTQTPNPTLKEIQKYLNENCMKCSFSVYESADHFGMSLPHFSKYYKDCTGVNVIDYTTSLRIEKAKELLRTTDIPITEIAEKVGYYNLSSFTRRFKINQGISPSEYRNSNSI